MNQSFTGNTVLQSLQLTFIRALATLGIAIAGVGLVPNLISTIERGESGIGVIATGLLILTNSIWLILVSQGRGRAAGIGLVVTLTIGALSPPPAFLVIATTAVIAAAVLLGRTGFILVNLVVFGRLAFSAIQFVQQNSSDVLAVGPEYLIPLIVIAIAGMSTRFFVAGTQRAAQETQQTANLLQSTAEVAQVTNQILALTPLLTRAVELIKERFDFYHVQVFFVDERREFAVLIASTGEIGAQLLERKHRLAVGSQSVIGQTTSLGKPILARDSDRQNLRYRNELLPWTRAELALPLLDGEQVIGALDVQSRDIDAFSDADVQALRVLSNLLATAIRNARLFEQQARTADENARLYQQTQSSLHEIERLNRELTSKAWQEYLHQARVGGVTLVNGAAQSENNWSGDLVQAAAGETIQRTVDNKSILAMPITVRGQVIGAVEIETNTTAEAEDTRAVHDVLERFALSLENARLYEAAQEASAQEQRLNEIAGRFELVGSIDDLMRITLSELGDTLGAEHGAIRLGILESDRMNGGGDAQ
jgi:GAF domain-containing protein